MSIPYLTYFSTIAKPFDGRMTFGKAFVLIICIWTYVLPWCFLPLTEKWNRFVPGKLLILNSSRYLPIFSIYVV